MRGSRPAHRCQSDSSSSCDSQRCQSAASRSLIRPNIVVHTSTRPAPQQTMHGPPNPEQAVTGLHSGPSCDSTVQPDCARRGCARVLGCACTAAATCRTPGRSAAPAAPARPRSSGPGWRSAASGTACRRSACPAAAARRLCSASALRSVPGSTARRDTARTTKFRILECTSKQRTNFVS